MSVAVPNEVKHIVGSVSDDHRHHLGWIGEQQSVEEVEVLVVQAAHLGRKKEQLVQHLPIGTPHT